MKFESPLERIGGTPVTRLGEHDGAVILIKEEGANPTGSLKDRTALGIVRAALESGKLKPEMRLLDTSSGSYACALAFVGRLFGFETTVVVNKKISDDNLKLLDMMGAEIIKHGTVTGDGREYCLELLKENPGRYYFTDQLTNPVAPDIHEQTTGPEIFEDLKDVTAIVASKGSGATLCGVSRFVRDHHPDTEVFGSIGVPNDEKKIAGTYAPDKDFRSPFIKELDELAPYAGDIPIRYREAMDTCEELARKGFLVGPQGGGVLTAARRAIDEHGLTGNVVIITGDSLLKNLSRFDVKKAE